jgi:hypothetical protein
LIRILAAKYEPVVYVTNHQREEKERVSERDLLFIIVWPRDVSMCIISKAIPNDIRSVSFSELSHSHRHLLSDY